MKEKVQMDALLSPRRRHVIAALGAAALGAACGARPGARADSLRFSGQTMGSTYSVRIAGGPFDGVFEAAARGAVTSAFEDVVRRMSTYDAGSELGRFNRHAATTPFALSVETLAVLARGQEVAALSGGAFDVTVAPLVAAWGFGAGLLCRGRVPSPWSAWSRACVLAQPRDRI